MKTLSVIVPVMQQIEPRRLLATVYPTAFEQYMVELYNWARANPSQAASRYGVALNEGLADGTISADPKQPLAINPYLTDAARSYAQWMIDHDRFGHYEDGRSPAQRMADAGYVFATPSGWAENLGYTGGSIGSDLLPLIDSHHRGFYVDAGIVGRGHRINMMNPAWKQVGSGIATGTFNGLNAFMSAQDFAYSGSGSFLTGVAYRDESGDRFYTPGEQLQGITIRAVRSSDAAEFSTITWNSGGYTLELPDGTYTIYGSGGALGGVVRYDNVVIAGQNVKRDFRPDLVNVNPGNDPPPWAVLAGGRLSITGTDADDLITLALSGGGTLAIIRNGQTATFINAQVISISISCGDGNDSVTLGPGVRGCNISAGNGNDTIVCAGGADRVYGGEGNDSILGGDGADILLGEAGDDTIFGGTGSDRIYGQAGNDSLDGQHGNDRILGGDGNDVLLGGTHSDTLYGEAGLDSLFGQNQNDLLDGGPGADYASGGYGTDTINYASRTAPLYIELSKRYELRTGRSGQAGERDNILNDIETIIAGSGDDVIVGSSAPNLIRAGAGNDTINSYGGADTILAADGNDAIQARDNTRDHIDGGAGTDTVWADAALDLLLAVEA
ncbi:CAP domain-containing protein [Fontivita pretiosa]|uniref:CAP domain-containing protein n=1 Tax=Fontivita pretiosa TaxID=2989684 RepID=UPI003D1739E6